MAGRLTGKTAIVTSAGQGIGRASAICLAKEGAKVWATDINAEALASLAAEQAGIETFTLNVLKQDEVDAALLAWRSAEYGVCESRRDYLRTVAAFLAAIQADPLVERLQRDGKIPR